MKRTLLLSLLMGLCFSLSSQTSPVNFNITVMLQGAWSGSSMQTHLNQDTLIPLQHPYGVPPWKYPGDESLKTIPANMVDWVLVELRSRMDTTIDRRAAVLMSDGSVVDTNGGLLQMAHYTNRFYIVVYHRNHLPIMTANPVYYGDSISCDFSDTQNYPAFGNDVLALGGGISGMIAGDVNLNKQLKYSGAGNDRAPILQKIVSVSGSNSLTGTIKGFHYEDINMNGVVKYSGAGNDPIKILQNLVMLTGSSALTSVYNSHVPDAYGGWDCGGNLLDPRDGKTYPTVVIGNQCWMGKNLNTGKFVQSFNSGGAPHSQVSDNDTIEKYCYNNDTNNCEIYGGLYDWDEMMDYGITPGAQGICPTGWHLPTHNEWKILQGNVDSQYGVGDPVWDGYANWQGSDVGGKLKEDGFTHWYTPNAGATNSSGFTALPAGQRRWVGTFSDGPGYVNSAYFWTSELNNATDGWFRHLNCYEQRISPPRVHRKSGLSVRCLRDTTGCYPQPDKADAGSDQMDVADCSVSLAANYPLYGLGTWSIISGTGGNIVNTLDPGSVFSGLTDSNYVLVWTIATQCSSTSDTVSIGFIEVPFVCGDTFTDCRDGQEYPTVLIGPQCWMAKNLNVGSFIQSNATGIVHSDASDNGIIEKYCFINDINKCLEYGGLYDWNEMMCYDSTPGIQGICPSGWHIPSHDEFTFLSSFLGGDAVSGGKMKEAGYTHWGSPNTAGTNSSGFTGLGAGDRYAEGQMYPNSERHATEFWSSTKYSSDKARYRGLLRHKASLTNFYISKHYGFSVRCMRDTIIIITPPK